MEPTVYIPPSLTSYSNPRVRFYTGINYFVPKFNPTASPSSKVVILEENYRFETYFLSNNLQAKLSQYVKKESAPYFLDDAGLSTSHISYRRK